jgi:hypothetical protein
MRCENSSRVLLLALCFSVLVLASGYGQADPKETRLPSEQTTPNELQGKLSQDSKQLRQIADEWESQSIALNESLIQAGWVQQSSELSLTILIPSATLTINLFVDYRKKSEAEMTRLRLEALGWGIAAVVAGGAAVGFGVAWALK